MLQHVIEWQAPDVRQRSSERIFLRRRSVLAIVAAGPPARATAAASCVVVFLAAALLGARNIAVASLVFVPVLAAAWPDVGSLRAASRRRPGSARERWPGAGR